MGIGIKRPLSCFCWIITLLTGVLLLARTRVALPLSCLRYAVIAGGILVVALVVCTHLFRKRAELLRYSAFLFAAVVLGGGVFLWHEARTYRPALAYAEASGGEEALVTGLVLSRDYDSTYQTTLTVDVTIPGTRRTVRGRLTTSYISELQPGDRFSCLATVRCLPDADAEEMDTGFYTDGGLLLLTSDDEMSETVTERGVMSAGFFWRNLQTRLSTRLCRSVSGEAGRLVSALLLGNADGLRRETVLNFRRAGVSHLLALSGLHLTLVMAFFSWLLRQMHVPFLARKLILPIFAVLYLLLTGCSVSTQRAVVMLLYLQLADLAGVPGDSMTSLSAFVAACVLHCPTAILDVGMWLSVIAAFVLVEVVPALSASQTGEADDPDAPAPPEKSKGGLFREALVRRLGRVLKMLAASCVISLFLMLPCALCFGELSLLSPLSTLLLTPLLEVCLILGMCLVPLLFFANFPLLGALCRPISFALTCVAKFMLSAVRYLGDRRHIMLSLRYPFVKWVLAFGVFVTLIFLLFRWKKPRRFIAVMAGFVLVFAVSLGVTVALRAGVADVTYVRHGKSELLCLHDTEATVLCDLSDGGYTSYRDFFDEALPDDTTEVEAVILTHYHNRHIASLRKLFNRIRVRSIWLPLTMPPAGESKAEQDEGIARAIAALAAEYRVRVHTYLPGEDVAVTDHFTLESLTYRMIPRSTHPTLAVGFRYEGRRDGKLCRLTYLGSSVWESDAWNALAECLPDSQTLIMGMHGPVLKTEMTLPECPRVSGILFANEEVFALNGDAVCGKIPETITAYVSDGWTRVRWSDGAGGMPVR